MLGNDTGYSPDDTHVTERHNEISLAESSR